MISPSAYNAISVWFVLFVFALTLVFLVGCRASKVFQCAKKSFAIGFPLSLVAAALAGGFSGIRGAIGSALAVLLWSQFLGLIYSAVKFANRR